MSFIFLVFLSGLGAHAATFQPAVVACDATSDKGEPARLDLELHSTTITLTSAAGPEPIYADQIYCGYSNPHVQMVCPYASMASPSEFFRDLGCRFADPTNSFLLVRGRLHLNRVHQNGYLECQALGKAAHQWMLKNCQFR